eukprot:2940654-Rhodomonas_salina.2
MGDRDRDRDGDRQRGKEEQEKEGDRASRRSAETGRGFWGGRYKGFAAMSNLNYGLGLPKNRVEMIWAMITMAVQ